MMRTTISAHAPERRFGPGGIVSWPIPASWMGTSFLIAFALAAIVLAIFGAGERSLVLALRLTARWSFLLFWLAYAGGAMAWLSGQRLGGLARRGRELGDWALQRIRECVEPAQRSVADWSVGCS